MTRIRTYKSAFKIAGAITVAVAVSALAAGCGGTSGGSSNSDARIRAVNLIPNGGTATVYVNSGSANGQQDFNQASTYLYVGPGLSTFTFLLSNITPTSLPIVSVVDQLDSNSAYTAFLVGNANVLTSGTPGFPQVQILSDNNPAVPSGDALVRVIDAAPDAAAINITVGSLQIDAAPLQYAGAPPVGTTVPPRSTGYVAVPAGSNTLTFTDGSSTLISQSASFSAGHAYSVFLTEPTFSPITYGVLQLDDAH